MTTPNNPELQDLAWLILAIVIFTFDFEVGTPIEQILAEGLRTLDRDALA